MQLGTLNTYKSNSCNLEVFESIIHVKWSLINVENFKPEKPPKSNDFGGLYFGGRRASKLEIYGYPQQVVMLILLKL